MKIKAMTIPELWQLAKKLQDGDWFGDSRTLSFGERPDGNNDASAWWGTLPVSHFDDDTWLVGYFGGGNTVAVDITDDPSEEEAAERFVEAVRGVLGTGENPDEEADTVYVDCDHIPEEFFIGINRSSYGLLH